METRAEHLDWCKQRALQELTFYESDDEGTKNAFASMVSDLGKHPETQGHAGIELGFVLILAGQLNTPIEMREYIEGFN